MNGSIRKPFLPGKPYYIANNEWFKGSGDPVNNAPILATEQAVNGECNYYLMSSFTNRYKLLLFIAE